MGEDAGIQDQITLALSEDGRKLVASAPPGQDRPPVDGAFLKRKAAAEGFGQLFLSDEAISQFIKRYPTSKEPVAQEVGEVRDAAVSVEITPDRMRAFVSVTPPYGGASVTREQIYLALEENQVSFGVLDEALDQIVAAGEARSHLAAQGREAVDGQDGQLQCLIETAKERRPRLDEHNIANYRDLGGIVTVHPGERLMRRIPPTPGEPGKNVLGQEISPVPGKEIMFATKLNGSRVDTHDASFLVADIVGQPVIVDHGVEVEPTITVKAVNIATGNIDFEGTVNVIEDVQAGMHIHATGDIHIGGTVEAAMLEAGGNVVIEGGIIGHGDVHLHRADNGKSAIGQVKCGASFTARFVENAIVQAGDSIQVADFVMQSELTAANQIIAGAPGTGKGQIIGGRTEATLLVQTALLGSQAGAKTLVMVGIPPRLHEQLTHITRQFETKAKELDEVIKLLAFLDAHPEKGTPAIREKAETTRLALLESSRTILQEKYELEQQLKLAVNAKVVVGKTVFGGTQIEIGSKLIRLTTDHEGGTFLLNEEGEIEYR